MRAGEIVELASKLRGAADAEGLAASLGEVQKRVGDWLILVTPREPRWSEARVETCGGRVSGIGITLKEPEAVRWDQLAARWGAPEVRPPRVDDPAGLGSIAFVPTEGDVLLVVVKRATEERVSGVIVRKRLAR